MDPNACLQRYLAACRDDDHDEVQDAAEDYNEWIRRNGFPAILSDGSRVWFLDDRHPGRSVIGGEAGSDVSDRLVTWSELAAGVS